MSQKYYPLHPGQTHPEPYYCTIPLEEYESLKKAQRWRKVSEELPEDEDKEYLVYNGKEIFIAMLTWTIDDDLKPVKEFFIDAPTSMKATHWMPLPEPPEEKR